MSISGAVASTVVYVSAQGLSNGLAFSGDAMINIGQNGLNNSSRVVKVAAAALVGAGIFAKATAIAAQRYTAGG